MMDWFLAPRLETRTKEFNVCVSPGVVDAYWQSESDCWDVRVRQQPTCSLIQD